MSPPLHIVLAVQSGSAGRGWRPPGLLASRARGVFGVAGLVVAVKLLSPHLLSAPTVLTRSGLTAAQQEDLIEDWEPEPLGKHALGRVD